MEEGLRMKSKEYLVISGAKGNIYVPASWWKPDYFEVRFEYSKIINDTSASWMAKESFTSWSTL